MAEEKKNNDIPTFIMTTPEISEKKRQYKKYAILACSVVTIVAIVLTAILVGIHLYSEAEQEIIKFAYTRDDNSKEEVTSDPNANVAQYHVSSDSYEIWVVNDFNRDIQVMKIHSGSGTNCYVTPLNRTTAEDPSQIVAPTGANSTAPKTTYHVTYQTGNDPISDSTFLCKSARDTCKGISTYWMYPSCDASTDMEKRKKRLSISVSFSIGRVTVTISVKL